MRTRIAVCLWVLGFVAPVAAQDPLSIVAHARALRSTPVGHENMAPLLREIAAKLNAAGVPDGPFGVLLKPTGENCGGYSCDIICSGNGAAQRQWDVFIAQEAVASPTWDEVPRGSMTVRVCELVPAHEPTPEPDPEPEPEPQPEPRPGRDLGPLLLKLAQLLEEIRDGQAAERAAMDAQTVALKTAIADLQKQVAAGVKIRF